MGSPSKAGAAMAGGRRLLAGLAIVVAVGGASGGLEQELKCEEAVKHLADCCPRLDARTFHCSTDGCHQPRLLTTESDCVLALDCDGIKTRGLCMIQDPGNESNRDGGEVRCP